MTNLIFTDILLIFIGFCLGYTWTVLFRRPQNFEKKFQAMTDDEIEAMNQRAIKK